MPIAVQFARHRRQPRVRQVIDADEHRDQHDPQPRQRDGDVERHRDAARRVAIRRAGSRGFYCALAPSAQCSWAKIRSASARRDARHAGEVLDARRLHAFQPAEMREQRLPALGARCPSISCSDEVVRALPRRARWPWIAKRCASSRICCSRCRPGMIGRQVQRAVAVRKHDVLVTGLALGPFGDADQRHARAGPARPAPRRRRRPGPCRRRSPAGRAPDTRRRRCARSAASAPRASPRSRRRPAPGVTLKRRYSDVCIASRSKITQDATARLAHRVRHVEALDALRRRRQAERLLQRGEAVLLRRLLREPLADRERRVLRRHRQPHAALAAGIGRRSRPCAPPARRARRRARPRRRPAGAIDRRRHRPLDVVLREERRHDVRADRPAPHAAGRTCGRRRGGRRGSSRR